MSDPQNESEWRPIAAWEEFPDVAAVYEIKNLASGLSYIGSAVRLNKRNHYKLLKAGKSHSVRLREAFEKNGEQAFICRILDLCLGQDPVALEQKRIDERNFDTLYNVAPIAGSSLGYQFTDEQKDRLSKSRKGVPVSDKARKAIWLKRRETDVKKRIYADLVKQFKKSRDYEALLEEIKTYLESNPNWGQPILLQTQGEDSWSDMGSDFWTWWVLGGGREYADKKYKFSNHRLTYVTTTGAELASSALEKHVGTMAETVRHIAESLLNKRFSVEVERTYAAAVASGEIDFHYRPPSPIDLSGFTAKSVELYEDKSVRSLTQTEGNITLFQEWYKSGSPKIAVIGNAFAEKVEKRAWREDGHLEYLLNFLNGKLHGTICKWDKDGQLTFAAEFENGIESTRLSTNDFPTESIKPLFERPPVGTDRGTTFNLDFSSLIGRTKTSASDNGNEH